MYFSFFVKFLSIKICAHHPFCIYWPMYLTEGKIEVHFGDLSRTLFILPDSFNDDFERLIR